VGQHETLWSICRAYGVSIESVCRFNRIKNPKLVVAGRKIFLPGADEVQKVIVKRSSIAREPGTPDPVVAKKHTNKKRPEPVRKVPATGPYPLPKKKKKALPSFRWPLKGRITSKFGIRNGQRHDGIDIAAPKGTPIHAAARGEVIYSDDGIRGYGNLVIIKHHGDFSTVYAHNLRNRVKVDDRVEKGRVIGYVGNTGRSTGYHLHFEIRKGTRAENPMKYLP